MTSAAMRQLLLFSVLALASYVVYEKYFAATGGTQYKPFTKGYALTGVTITSTDDDGRITNTIEAPAVTHYADTEKTVIEEPRIHLYGDEDKWLFTSAVGELSPDQNTLYFPEQVNISLLGTPEEQVDIVTSALQVNVTDKTGKTAAPFRLDQAGSWMRSIGAELKFNEQEINLLSEMYAEFEN